MEFWYRSFRIYFMSNLIHSCGAQENPALPVRIGRIILDPGIIKAV